MAADAHKGAIVQKSTSVKPRLALMAATAAGVLAMTGTAQAQKAPVDPSSAVAEVVITATKTTRSSVAISGPEIQKLMPGVNPLKAIQSLPGVLFETADPWGNNEQNEALFVHGFSTQQLGYTMDGLPLGDQQYGNYNGLSPSRALTSENVGRVVLSSGAGGLGVASTSNLGGAIETFSRDPSTAMGADVRETLGSYDTTRTFVRLDTGETGFGAGYVSYLHQDAKAWDFNGHQKGDQVNLKYVHDDSHGKLTLFADWSNKVEPNEDAVGFGNQAGGPGTFVPYTRPFLYPNLAACTSTIAPNSSPTTGNGAKAGSPPTYQGNNFSNCFSAAQRTDLLSYAKYDYHITSNLTWSTQAYYHYDWSRGIVAGPINQAGLPALFAAYYPNLVVGGSATSAGTLANIASLFGGTGNEVRTTEYLINRGGVVSNLDWQVGQHQIEAGIWYEHNEDSQHRAWYPFSAANNDLSPYTVPTGHLFDQYYMKFFVNDVELHLQDQWRILPNLLLQAGFKSSLQTASNKVPIEQVNILPGNPGGLAPTNPPVVYPTGTLTSNNWFLPQFGAVWDFTSHEQAFANIQENMRQFIPYGAGSNFYGFSPWSLGTQSAFNLFKATVHPETSWTYEVGVRTHRTVDLGLIDSVDGQASVYHVDFRNRLLNVAPYNFINPPPAILENVGGVATNGVDIAGTVNFAGHFHLYDGVSYNKSTYDSNYVAGVGGLPTTVPLAGKWVPETPDWLNKTILSFTDGPFEAQISGDYVGRRYATYLNDIAVAGNFQVGLEASYQFQVPTGMAIRTVKLSGNVINLTDTKGVSTIVVTGNSGGYQGYPIAPTMAFVTLQATF